MPDTQLQKWVLIAELASGLAVVITLIFLIHGMRENTNAIQAQTFQELMRDVNDWRSSIRDLEREGLLFRFIEEGPEKIDPNEVVLIRLVFLELWGIYESAYFANQRGVLGPEEWKRFEFQMCNERRGISDSFFEADHRGLPAFEKSLTPAFSNFLQQKCN